MCSLIAGFAKGKVVIAFITSIRHPLNSANYTKVLRLLEASLKSVCNQTNPDFRVIVVCNEQPEPRFKDERVEYVRVDFPPPSTHQGPRTTKEAVRKDKGAKYVVGLLAAKKYNPEYVMFFDADDFVHRDIAQYCNSRPGENGWYVDKGYVYCSGSMIYGRLYNFYKWCGTCNIVRYRLMPLPASVTIHSSLDEIVNSVDEYFLYKILGAHPFTVGYFSEAGTPLSPLPFCAAIYVRETGENHSGIFYGGLISGLPSILNTALLRDFGMDMIVTGRLRFTSLFTEYPLTLYRVLRYGKKVTPPV